MSASQKAPSAKRCIKTFSLQMSSGMQFPGQKAPSAKRCIKTANSTAKQPSHRVSLSESTERQKVH